MDTQKMPLKNIYRCFRTGGDGIGVEAGEWLASEYFFGFGFMFIWLLPVPVFVIVTIDLKTENRGTTSD